MNRSTALKGLFPLVSIVTIFSILVACVTLMEDKSNQADVTSKFATWNGLGPDKWASIWLVQRHITPNVRVQLLPEGSKPADLILFDTPGAAFRRTTDTSAFEQLVKGHQVDQRDVLWLKRIIHDIDINLWGPDQLALSAVVERGYRSLQRAYGRDRVPYDCYMQFFDNVASTASMTTKQHEILTVEALLPSDSCGQAALSLLKTSPAIVPELAVFELFDVMRSGAQVVFVDVREPEEFSETHVPGAINVQIRNLDASTIESLKQADLVVSYCVKDFRGFEMAKKLRESGVETAVILKPYGIRGWINAGLPVNRGDDPVNNHSAMRQLSQCVERRGECKATL